MVNQLFFVCPTDGIESLINEKLGRENYFVSSVGLSFSICLDFLDELFLLINENNIGKITLVLSDQNRVFLDAIDEIDLNQIVGLSGQGKDVLSQYKSDRIHWKTSDLRIPILSKFLEERMNDLKAELEKWYLNDIEINSKIFRTKSNELMITPSGLFERKIYNLN